MGYNIKVGDKVTMHGNEGLEMKVLSAPQMSRFFADKGETFGWVKCRVLNDPSGKYKKGYESDFNGDFIRKL